MALQRSGVRIPSAPLHRFRNSMQINEISVGRLRRYHSWYVRNGEEEVAGVRTRLRKRSVRPWARSPAGCPRRGPSNRRSAPLQPPSGRGAESEDETRGVGTIWSDRQPHKGFSPLASAFGWPVRRRDQPLCWWLSGDTDAKWLDRCGEDADRPFFHGLAERLPVYLLCRIVEAVEKR